MKKISSTLIMLLLCITTVKSQLQVDSTGYVGIGVTEEILEYDDADSIMSPFSVFTAGSIDAIASVQSTDRLYSISTYNIKTGNNEGIGVFSHSSSNKGNSLGVFGVGMSNNTNPSYTNSVIGVRGSSLGGYNTVGVYGGSYLSDYALNNFAGIYGSTRSSYPYFQRPGSYAGYFYGKVYVTDTLFAPVLYLSATTSSGNNSSVKLIGEEEHITDKLRKISSFELQHNEFLSADKRQNPVEESLKGRDIQQLSKKELHQLDSISLNIQPTETDLLSSVNYGLDAEQLKSMFPKLVQQDKEGNYSINYIEMIPLLVKSINELSEELEELKGTSAKRAKAQSATTGFEETVSDIDIVRMDQNKPNPFSESTVIGLNIPEKTQKANVFIYDLSGKQIQRVPVTERGETNITVYAGDLGAGMYIYTLVTDGRVVVTRKMIVEK